MKRRPRFQRDSSSFSLRLTARDLEILRHVSRHRFLSSRQICLLVGGSHQQILRRLQRLYHNRFLDRPRVQIQYFSASGMQPLVYGLGRASAQVITEPGEQPRRYDNRNVKQLYLQHTLLVADVVIAFELACRGRSTLKFVSERDLVAASKDPGVGWFVNIDWEGERKRVGVVPDAVFALEATATRERILFFVEADRSTMPVTRHSLNKSSLVRKLLAYEATWQQGVHREKFGCDRFRMLTVTTSASRVDSAVAACGKLSRGRGLFLFAEAKLLQTSVGVLVHPWRNAAGGTESISV